MKRKLFGIVSLFVALISLLSLNSCEEVIHFYTVEVTIIDNQGNLMSGFKVTTDVDVNDVHVVDREAYTDSTGVVSFEFKNEAIMKVVAEQENYSGEGLIVLEEDKNVKVTVVVYE
tara:strand:+ start:235 stop:582 length:348 start_codon:yes stop_codon:yes gene_type:complete